MKRSKADVVFDAINIFFMVMIVVIMIYPLYFSVIASISDPTAVARGMVIFYPRGVTTEAYRNVFANDLIWVGYKNSLIYTVFGTLLNLTLTLPTAYALSKRFLPGRSVLSWYFLFTMYFGGGLIPTYLLVDKLGLINKPYTLIFLGGVSIFNIIVSRIFFQSTVPEELFESAQMDGASNFRQFFQIALPLATPIIAVMALFYGASRWNDYVTALIYLSKTQYMPLQMVLRSVLIQNQMLITIISSSGARELSDEAITEMARKAHMAQAMKYALIFIASAPLLCAYPFVQKYFVKGVMIGSLKG